MVETPALARCLKEFVAGWEGERPCLKGRRGVEVGDVIPLTAMEYLVERSGLTAAEIRSVRRPAKKPTVSLMVADALVAACGRPDWFYDGTLTVRTRNR